MLLQVPHLLRHILRVLALATMGTIVSSSGKGMTAMYWYNPTSRISERVEAPGTDKEAIEMLAGDLQSAAFVSDYGRLRDSGMEIEQALILVGHEFRLRHLEVVSPSAFRSRAVGYDVLVGTGPSSRR